MISDTPGRGGGEGGQKRENFCGRPLWMAPKQVIKTSFNPESRSAKRGGFPIILSYIITVSSQLNANIVATLSVEKIPVVI